MSLVLSLTVVNLRVPRQGISYVNVIVSIKTVSVELFNPSVAKGRLELILTKYALIRLLAVIADIKRFHTFVLRKDGHF